MKKILIPIDGSKASKNAVDAAKKIGEKFDSKLIIMTVVPETSIIEQYPANFPYTLEIEKANTERAEYVLSDIEKGLEDYSGEVQTIYTSGNPSQQITKFAEDNDIDLIVMGNRGLGAFSRTLLGSVSNKVLNQSKVSVLVVKGEIEE